MSRALLCRGAALVGLVAVLLVAACTRSADSDDPDRHATFYGGVSGGATLP